MSEIPRQQESETEPVIETAGEKTDAALSPEIIEKIMAKVQDINAPEIGYTIIKNGGNGKLMEFSDSIFKDGLLGQNISYKNRKEDVPLSRESWAENARKNKDAVVWFNITGRGQYKPRKKDDLQINSSQWINSEMDSVVLLFDISHFDEKEPTHEGKQGYPNSGVRNDRNFLQENRKYRLDDHSNMKRYGRWKETGFDRSELSSLYYDGVDTEYGFVLSHRVAPRFFSGVVIKATRPRTPEEIKEEMTMWRVYRFGQYKSEQEQEEYRKRLSEYGVEDPNWLLVKAKEISERLQNIYKEGKENLLIPIYDIDGNLLWPEQMSYENVKRFVAERDKKE